MVTLQTLAGSSRGHPHLSWVGRRGPAARTARWPGLSLGLVWVPPAARCSVIGRRADLGPPLPPPRLCPLCGREGDSLSGGEQLETWRASFPGAWHRAFSSSSSCPPGAGGHRPRRGAPLLHGQGVRGMHWAPTAARPTLCAGLCAVEWLLFSPWYLFP